MLGWKTLISRMGAGRRRRDVRTRTRARGGRAWAYLARSCPRRSRRYCDFSPDKRAKRWGPKKIGREKQSDSRARFSSAQRSNIGSLARRRRFLTDRVFVASDKRAHRHRHRDRRHAGRDSASLPRVPGQISIVELKHEFHSNRGKRTNRIRLRLHLAYFILSAFR